MSLCGLEGYEVVIGTLGDVRLCWCRRNSVVLLPEPGVRRPASPRARQSCVEPLGVQVSDPVVDRPDHETFVKGFLAANCLRTYLDVRPPGDLRQYFGVVRIA